MTLPLVVPVALLGASLGYHLQASPRDPGGMSRLLLLLAGASVPLFATEALTPDRPMRQSVVTAVVIAAPPEVVWPRVVAFPPLPEPSDWMLRDTGIAYPIGARIEGKGPGACRHCEFSTGAFVEPITVWREAELLRFDVVASPPTMVEWNPFANIQPPHLEGFLHSKQGQFRLQRLDDGSTLLEGTTWYENAMWPSSYWDVWCRTIIGKIHREVLEHVKNLAEGDERSL